MNKIGGIETEDIIIKKNGIFPDLTLILGKSMEWMPILAYLFANVCFVTKDGKVILVLTEERKVKNIWVIPGGELLYKILESFETAVIREAGKEEMGLRLDPKKMKIFDAQIGYPTEGSPYEKMGITSVIISYLYRITDRELKKIKVNAVPEKRYNIVKVLVKPVPEVLQDIEEGKINVYPALKETLVKLILFLKEGKNIPSLFYIKKDLFVKAEGYFFNRYIYLRLRKFYIVYQVSSPKIFILITFFTFNIDNISCCECFQPVPFCIF